MGKIAHQPVGFGSFARKLIKFTGLHQGTSELLRDGHGLGLQPSGGQRILPAKGVSRVGQREAQPSLSSFSSLKLFLSSSSIHAITKGISSFFLSPVYYSIVYMYHDFLIHSFTVGYLGFFQHLAIVISLL